MTQLSSSFDRPASSLPLAIGGMLVAGAIVVGALAAAIGFTPAAPTEGVVAPRPASAINSNQLYSEYLLDISADWSDAAPSIPAPAMHPGQAYSEYLLDISADW